MKVQYFSMEIHSLTSSGPTEANGIRKQEQAGRQTPGRHLQAKIQRQGAGNVGSPLAGYAFGFQRTPSAGR